MSVDPAFKECGKTVGLEAWRIENKSPVSVKENDIGKLHTGDSYIYLKTYKKTSNALFWNIHFWLGADSSPDERGIAAYKAVELDEFLGGSPVQYRECQNYETDLFKSYFKDCGLQYLSGGVESGFHHIERGAYRDRLLHVKGRRTMLVKEVKCHNSSLNTGDVFVLDCGLTLFQYNGKNANTMEKAKAQDLIQKIRNDERGAKATIVMIDEEPHNEKFWKTLGGEIVVEKESEDDAIVLAKSHPRLFCISDASESLVVTEVTPDDKKLRRELLHEEDVFLVDVDSEIFIWVGSKSSAQEKKNSMSLACDYLIKHNKSENIPITRIIQGGETAVFKSLFYQWNPPQIVQFNRSMSSGIATSTPQEKVNVKDLVQKKCQQEESMIDDGNGTIKIWRIENMQKVEYPLDLYGQFFGGDSYIILYISASSSDKDIYKKSSKEQYIIYFWQGRDSSIDEKGASAILSIALEKELAGHPAVQVRVTQGKEPAHFHQLFKGRMIVHLGGHSSGFKNLHDEDTYDTDGVSLYQIKGTTELNTYASQVKEEAKYLNSGDCFVLVTPKSLFIWKGSKSTDEEYQVATNVANIIMGSRTLIEVKEHEEPEDFWEFLGGKDEYPEEKDGVLLSQDARLFQCSNASGTFKVEEIYNFTQEDLCDEDVMLLDTYSSVYLWIGSKANKIEKEMSNETALAYVQEANDGRGTGIPIITIEAGHEPQIFTCHFIAWDPDFFTKTMFKDPYLARLAKLKQLQQEQTLEDKKGTKNNVKKHVKEQVPLNSQNDQQKNADEAINKNIPILEKHVEPQVSSNSQENLQYYPVEQLIAGIESVDPAKKESYLSDSDFQSIFGLTKIEFYKLPKWKQVQKKKEKKLF